MDCCNIRSTNKKVAEINNKSMEDMTMKNSKKNVVITGKMMVKAFMVVALVATVVLMGLEKKKAEKKSEKSEVVA